VRVLLLLQVLGGCLFFQRSANWMIGACAFGVVTCGCQLGRDVLVGGAYNNPLKVNHHAPEDLDAENSFNLDLGSSLIYIQILRDS